MQWDATVLHVRAGGLEGMQWGVSEVYAAIGWARLYKGFLEDWAALAKALSKFAWKATTKGQSVSRLRATIEETGSRDSPPPPRREGAGKGGR